MDINELTDSINFQDDSRIGMRIFGYGSYGKQVIKQLIRDGITNVKYGLIGEKHAGEAAEELLRLADLAFIIADLGELLSAKDITEVFKMCKERLMITVLILSVPDDGITGETVNPRVGELKGLTDILFTVPKQKSHASYLDAEYRRIFYFVKALTDICGDRAGYLNTDFGDVHSCLRNGGTGCVGYGEAYGDNGLSEATAKALFSLTEVSLSKAKGVIVTIDKKDCLINDVADSLMKIAESCGPFTELNYNIYDNPAVPGMCRVIISAFGIDSNR